MSFISRLRRTTFRVDPKIHSQILDLKSEMNKKRVNFTQPHRINITPY